MLFTPLYSHFDRIGYRLSRSPLVGETHQLLGGMYVNVHLARVNLYIECHRRVAARGDGSPVGVIQSPGKNLGSYPPAVYGDRLA